MTHRSNIYDTKHRILCTKGKYDTKYPIPYPMAITITKAGRKEPSDGGGMEAGELGSPTKFALGGGGVGEAWPWDRILVARQRSTCSFGDETNPNIAQITPHIPPIYAEEGGGFDYVGSLAGPAVIRLMREHSPSCHRCCLVPCKRRSGSLTRCSFSRFLALLHVPLVWPFRECVCVCVCISLWGCGTDFFVLSWRNYGFSPCMSTIHKME